MGESIMIINELAEFILYDLAIIAGAFVVIIAWVLVGLFILATAFKRKRE